VRSLKIKGFSFSWAEAREGIIRSCFCPPETLRREIPGALIENGGEFYAILQDYARGKGVALEKLPVVLSGTSFQRRVWRWTRGIKYGETVTYGKVARALGTFPRAVGRALAANRIPLFVPCHRVVAERGLGGFTPDVKIKRTLLELEGGWHD